MRLQWPPVCVAVLLANSAYAQAEEISNLEKIERSAFIPAKLAQQQIDEIKEALAHGSCLEVAEWVKYPFAIRTNGRAERLLFADSAFCRDFPAIFKRERIEAFLSQSLEETARADGGFYFWKSGLAVQAECPKFLDLECRDSDLQLRIKSVDL